MSSWSQKRKSAIAIAVAVVIIGGFVIPAFLYIYKAPTCSDGILNGKEEGIDCGGACERLCQNSFLPANVSWTRFEEVAPGLYNIATYIVNPNNTGEADNVPYHMAVYDDKGMLITDQTGKVTLPPHRNTLAYKGSVDTGKRKPSKVLFEFTKAPVWYTNIDPLSSITIGAKDYLEDGAGSSLSVELGNNSILPLRAVTVYAVLYDKNSNALGFSRTEVDEVPAQGKAIAPFTWPVDRKGAVISIEVLPVSE